MELYIGGSAVYSTSGGVCFNQECSKLSDIKMKINGKDVMFPVTQGWVQGKHDFYAFQYTLGDLKVTLPGFSDPSSPSITGSYRYIEEEQQLREIINTITY